VCIPKSNKLSVSYTGVVALCEKLFAYFHNLMFIKVDGKMSNNTDFILYNRERSQLKIWWVFGV
jgi:hypothetical protein